MPEARFARLTRGINTSHWFAQAEISPSRFRTYITAEDIQRITDIGFRHIRLSLNPLVLIRVPEPDALQPGNLPYFDAALDMILAHGLAVIVDVHPEDDFKRRLARDQDFIEAVARFWRALARHVSKLDPERVFLEVMNESTVKDPLRWTQIQQRLLAAMREGAPRHTLLATGYDWGNIEHLLALRPVADANVVYNFHFYEPYNFTHQGATWGDQMWRYLRNVPYPSSPEAVAPLLDELEPRVRGRVGQYGREQWNASKVDARIKLVADWAQRYSLRVTCNEFGVYRPFAPHDSRLAWLHDVRTSLERYDIGWAMWDYAGGFGVVAERDGRRVVHTATVHALGL